MRPDLVLVRDEHGNLRAVAPGQHPTVMPDGSGQPPKVTSGQDWAEDNEWGGVGLSLGVSASIARGHDN